MRRILMQKAHVVRNCQTKIMCIYLWMLFASAASHGDTISTINCYRRFFRSEMPSVAWRRDGHVWYVFIRLPILLTPMGRPVGLFSSEWKTSDINGHGKCISTFFFSLLFLNIFKVKIYTHCITVFLFAVAVLFALWRLVDIPYTYTICMQCMQWRSRVSLLFNFFTGALNFCHFSVRLPRCFPHIRSCSTSYTCTHMNTHMPPQNCLSNLPWLPLPSRPTDHGCNHKVYVLSSYISLGLTSSFQKKYKLFRCRFSFAHADSRAVVIRLDIQAGSLWWMCLGRLRIADWCFHSSRLREKKKRHYGIGKEIHTFTHTRLLHGY